MHAKTPETESPVPPAPQDPTAPMGNRPEGPPGTWASPAPMDLRLSCDLCHAAIGGESVFHRVTVGMNEESPQSWPDRAQTTVEEVSEMVVCAVCEPKVTARFDAFLTELWDMREDEPDEPPPPLPCHVPPPGWACSRERHHDGPCAARPSELGAVHESFGAPYVDAAVDTERSP